MMTRREFLQRGTLGAVMLSTSGLYMLSNMSKAQAQKNGKIRLEKAIQEIPIIENVDIVVIGGTSAGVSAAATIAQNGGKVFLVAEEPYLGVDLCGTYRHLLPPPQPAIKGAESKLAKHIFKDDAPTPLQVKKILDDQLINHDVGFFYSSFLYDLLVDDKGHMAGVVIANRSGLQAIRAAVVIDATLHAVAARKAGVEFTPFEAGDYDFDFVVVGNKARKAENLNLKQELPNVTIADKQYPVLHYQYRRKLTDGNLKELAKVEQEVREKTWEAGQTDSSDIVFFTPGQHIVSGLKAQKNSNDFPINSGYFKPENLDGLYVLSAYADIEREKAKQLLEPKTYMAMGKLIGVAAYQEAVRYQGKARRVALAESGAELKKHGKTTMGWDFVRQSLAKGTIEGARHHLPLAGEYDVLVIGGGTAGAPAALSAARHGAKTLVAEYMHGLGGMGTMGLISLYYHGYREGFTKEVDKAVMKLGGEDHPRWQSKKEGWIKEWKKEWYRQEIIKAGGEIWFGVIAIGAVSTEKKQVKGVVLATPLGPKVVLAHTIIDSTGSADVAIAAGAEYEYTNESSVAVQGAGLPPVVGDRCTNTDWTFINDSDVYDIWRTFVAAKMKYKTDYDIGKLLQTRERRRIIGDYVVQVLDLYNERVFADTISLHQSSFDTHGFTVDPFFTLKPPGHSGLDVFARVPFRALLPKGIDGIMVTGLGASAHRDAMPVIRMQPCLQNQGYTVGYAAALAAKQKITIRKIDVREVQKKAIEFGNLPQSVLTAKDKYPPSDAQIKEALETVTDELKGLEILMWVQDKAATPLRKKYKTEKDKAKRLTLARILAYWDYDDGFEDILAYVDQHEGWDEGWHYRGMGQFGESMSYLDSMILALGLIANEKALPVIAKKANQLTAEHAFSHFRVLAMACQLIKGKQATEVVYKLLNIKGIQGHATCKIKKVRNIMVSNWTDTSIRNQSLKELVLAVALFRCGDLDNLGKNILQQYAIDLRGHYARHANMVLKHSGKK